MPDLQRYETIDCLSKRKTSLLKHIGVRLKYFKLGLYAVYTVQSNFDAADLIITQKGIDWFTLKAAFKRVLVD